MENFQNAIAQADREVEELKNMSAQEIKKTKKRAEELLQGLTEKRDAALKEATNNFDKTEMQLIADWVAAIAVLKDKKTDADKAAPIEDIRTIEEYRVAARNTLCEARGGIESEFNRLSSWCEILMK